MVERITYQNAENGFSVIKCRAKGYSDLVTVVGNMPDVHVGSVLTMQGQWRIDGKYGRQFSAEKWEETLPATTYGIEKYLGSGLIKGVGPKFAKRIVQQFGKDTLEIIETEPDRLIEVVGIGQKRVNQVKKSWQEQKEIKNIMLFLQSNDVSTSHAAKIYRTYGNESIKIVEENPYKLADDIWGIGFKTADTIASKLGIEKNRFIRLRSGLMYTLNKLSESGHCYAVREQLIEAAVKLLDVEAPELEMTLDEMLRTSDVIKDEDAIYLPPFYFSETGCAKRLIRLMQGDRRMVMDTEKVMQEIERDSQIHYDEVQLQAIRQAIDSKVMVLTGGPGTGKTTTMNGIISAYRKTRCRIILAAPTGRAAKRMSEATCMEAKTIHRLLEYKPPEGYQKNEEHPLEGDVLILDECSMIDVMLMYNLLKALPEEMTLILVGDTDQLPSVGAGNVLKDIIASGCIPVVRLTRIFRQAQGSRIIMNAHRINKGEMPELRGGRDSDFFFAAKDTNEEVVDLLVKYCTKNLPSYYHVNAFSDIQVLTPMQRGTCGAANLNQVLQEAMNPGKIYLKRGGTQYRLQDKVMQIRNNYDKDVFNGDIGIIENVNMDENELTVDFDGRHITYDVTELDELVLAYATTIHKSQGSEYPIVVMPFTMSHYVMLQRNLLYTGVTRAKKILVLIGEKKAIAYATRNETTTSRNTKLAERIANGWKDAVKNSRKFTETVTETTTGECAGKSVDQAIEVNRRNGVDPSNSQPYTNQPYKQDAEGLPMVAEKRIEYGTRPGSEAEPFENLFARLAQSNFRSRFTLKAADKTYVREKGMDKIRSHACDFVSKRLAPAEPTNDGKQTPMKGHPVFIAQHATACCCRGCLEKWHRIPKGKELSDEQQKYVVDVLMAWIEGQMKAEAPNIGANTGRRSESQI
ncbi:MAG: ATP-dependent RecD-like DNA helicase [Lachnospiraceae bacterium]|nr:ATP-dependent RecD-like DNA helicase [Lachnospiraceae bacterium]